MNTEELIEMILDGYDADEIAEDLVEAPVSPEELARLKASGKAVRLAPDPKLDPNYRDAILGKGGYRSGRRGGFGRKGATLGNIQSDPDVVRGRIARIKKRLGESK